MSFGLDMNGGLEVIIPLSDFTPDNAFNAIEAAAVATIQGDAWLGNTGNVALVHEKVRMGPDPEGLYLDHELPAIGVLASGGDPDDKHTTGEFEEFIRLGFDVWVAGGDFDAADTLAKQIVARLRSLMRIQAFAPAINPNSSRLNGYLIGADGDIDNEGYDFEYFPAERGGWLVHGVTTSKVTTHSED